MLLKNRVAVVYGGGGAIGGACARSFAREGATVYLAGRTQARLEAVAGEILAAGGAAHVAVVDALDAEAVERHAEAVVAESGAIDVALNAVGLRHVQGPPLSELSWQDFSAPLVGYARTHFVTAKAVARHLGANGRGVFLTLSTPGARLSGVGFLGNGVASAAVEAFSRILAGELGSSGVRVVCIRPDAIPQAVVHSHSGEVFESVARRHGLPVDALLEGRANGATLLKRLPTLDQVADFAAFVASDRAGAMTGAIVNLSCGALVD